MTPRDTAAHVLAEHDQASGFVGKDYRKYLCTCGADVGSDDGHRAHVAEALDAAGVLAGGVLDAVEDAVGLVARVHEIHRHIVMDTPEDQRLHDEAVAVADKALAHVRALVGQQRGRDGGA